MKSFLRHSFVLLVFCSPTFSLSQENGPINLIVNGSFEEHPGNIGSDDVERFDWVPGWDTTRGQIEIHKGDNLGLRPVDRNKKLELDSGNNSRIFQIVETEAGKTYNLHLSYAPRNPNLPDNSNRIAIWWDGERLDRLNSNRKRWKQYTWQVTASSDMTRLELRGIGLGDNKGGLVDNVQLIPNEEVDNLVVNGSFEEHGELNRGTWGTFESIPGWQASQDLIEIQRGDHTGIDAADGNKKLELDANNNAIVFQTVLTESGASYNLHLNYTPRDPDRMESSNQISVWWNGEKVDHIIRNKLRWREFSWQVTADSTETRLELRGEGLSDSFGGLVDNVRLYKVTNKDPGGGNEKPQSNPQNLDIIEDESVDIVLTGRDPENQTLTFEVLTQPTLGTLSGTAPNLTYTPNSNVSGTDQFSFKTNDGELDSDPVDVVITIQAQNDVPEAESQAISTLEDQAASITLVGSDIETDAASLIFNLNSLPQNGSLSGIVPNLIYTPNDNFFGQDSFSFTVSDGELTSTVAQVTIDVESQNDAPVANIASAQTDEDVPVDLMLSAVDIDGDPLTYTIISPPALGTLSGVAPNLVYTPNPGMSGTDSFTYQASDGELTSVVTGINVTVNTVNDAPIADAQNLETQEDTVLNIILTGSDEEGDNLGFQVTTQPAQGTILGTSPNLIYTPNADFNGSDSFTFVTNDGQLDSNTATVDIAILAVNDAPTAANLSLQTNEDEDLVLTLQGADIEGDALTYSIVDTPIKGSLTGTAPNLTYVPNADDNGADSFTYKVNDGQLGSEIATVNIDVTPVNDPPTATETTTVSVEADNQINITLEGTDIDGDLISFQITQQPTNGTLSGTAPDLSYTPNTGFVGTDQFSYVLNDGQSNSATATVVINVTEANVAPVITSLPPQQQPVEGGAYVYQVLAEDQNEHDNLTYQLDTAPEGAQINPSTGEFVWVPQVADAAIGSTESDQYCYKEQLVESDTPLAVDTVYVIDETSTSLGRQEWLKLFVNVFDAYSQANLLGSGEIKNQYGLVGFGANRSGSSSAFIKRFLLGEDDSLFSSVDSLTAALDDLVSSGEFEEGYGAIDSALGYPFRENTIKQLLMSTDEDRDILMPALTRDVMIDKLVESNVILHIAAAVEIQCQDGRVAMGMDAQNVGYVANSQGGYSVCRDATILLAPGVNPNATIIEDYLPLVQGSGGSIWDERNMGEEGPVFDSFSRAYPEVIGLIGRERAAKTNQPDLAIESLSYIDNTLSVSVINRGLVDITEPFNVVVTADSVQIAELAFVGLTQGQSQLVTYSHPGPLDGVLQAEIQSASSPGNLPEECHADNNQANASEIKVRVTDERGLSDIQAFSVAVKQKDLAPVFTSEPEVTARLGELYNYQPVVDDSYLGDSVVYSLSRLTGNMRINTRSGLVTYRPNENDPLLTTIEIVATDLSGQQTSQTYELSLDTSYQFPEVISEAPIRAIQGQPYSYQAEASFDPSTDVSFRLYNEPEGLTVDSITGELFWDTPSDAGGERYFISLEVRDANGNYALQYFYLIGDVPPSPIRIVQNEAELRAPGPSDYEFFVETEDDNFVVTKQWTPNILPPQAQFDTSTEQLIWPGEQPTNTLDSLEGINDYCINTQSGDSVFDNKTLWSSGSTIYQPQVGQLYDSNQDGVLNENDRKLAVGISSMQSVIALDALTGEQIWESTVSPMSQSNVGAIVPTDNPQQAFYVYPNLANRLVALNADGSLRWISLVPAASDRIENNAVVISDLDNDGTVEIILGPSVFDAEGNLLWSFPFASFNRDYRKSSPYVVDLDQDGFNEVVFQREVRRHDGTLQLQLSALSASSNILLQSHFSSGNFDADPELELVAIHNSFGAKISLIDDDGSEIWTTSTPATTRPLVVDIDNDGVNEIYNPTVGRLYDTNGELLWVSALTSSGVRTDRTAVAVDFEQDGTYDFAQYIAGQLILIDGNTGFVKWRFAIQDQLNKAPSSRPVIADINEDGSADILLGAKSNTALISSSDALWAAAAVRATQLYHGNNDNSLFQLVGLMSDPDSRASTVRGDQSGVLNFLPDLAVLSAKADPLNDTELSVTVEIANEGIADVAAGSTIDIYWDQLPASDAGYEAKIQLGLLEAGGRYTYQVAIPKETDGIELFTDISAPVGIEDCDTDNNSASAYRFKITVEDQDGSDNETWAIGYTPFNDAPSNQAPVLASFPVGETATIGELYQFQPSASDINVGDRVSFSLASSPAGTSIDTSAGLISWVPQANQVGSNVIQVVATDRYGGRSIQNLTVTVAGDGNVSPITIGLPDQTKAVVNQPYQGDITASSDLNGVLFSYELLSGPEGLALNALTGQIEWIPAIEQLGIANVMLRVSDNFGNTADASLTLEVLEVPANTAPIIVSSPLVDAVVGELYSYQVEAEDAEGDALTYELLLFPVGMTMDSNGLIQWLQEEFVFGTLPVTIRVTDTQGLFVEQSYEIDLDPGVDPAPPILTNPPIEDAFVDVLYEYEPVARDYLGIRATVTLVSGPTGMELIDVDGNGVLQWLPPSGQCFIPVSLLITDQFGLTTDISYEIKVHTAPKRLNRFQCSLDDAGCGQ